MIIDDSDLRALAVDLGTVEARVLPKIRPIVSKGALNIKNQLQREARESAHFDSLAPSIGYDMGGGSFGGDSVIEAEIGPDRSRGSGAGLLGAYWGWSRGGGGTLPDPIVALAEEEPRFVEAMAKVAGYVFD